MCNFAIENVGFGDQKHRVYSWCQYAYNDRSLCAKRILIRLGDFLASTLSTYDLSTLYTTLPHTRIKEKLIEVIKPTFNREGSLYLACNEKRAFSLLNL